MTNRNRFLIIGRARSATTMIHRALREHPNISLFYEELNPFNFFSHGPGLFGMSSGRNIPEEEKKLNFLNLFDALSSCQNKEDTLANGFKIALWQRQGADVVVENIPRYFKDVKIILLFRKNLLDQFISQERARNYNTWHSIDFEKERTRHSNERIRISTSDFIHFIVESKRIDQKLLGLWNSNPCIQFEYESDILANLESVFLKINDFLETPHVNLNSKVMDKLPVLNPSLIKNMEEARAIFHKTIQMTPEEIEEKYKKELKKRSSELALKKYRRKITSRLFRVKK